MQIRYKVAKIHRGSLIASPFLYGKVMKKKAVAKKKSAPKKKMVQIAKGVKVSKAKEKKMEKRPGGSNVGKYKNVKKKDFAGPKGGSPQGSFPINDLKHARSALRLAHNAPNPEGIKRAVYAKYPALKPKSKKKSKK